MYVNDTQKCTIGLVMGQDDEIRFHGWHNLSGSKTENIASLFPKWHIRIRHSE